MPDMALVFKALSDETRQRILEMLTQRDMSAGEIAAAFPIAQPSVSHHLAVLKQAELVLCRRRGQQVIYSLNRAGLDECWERFFSRILRPARAKWDEDAVLDEGSAGFGAS